MISLEQKIAALFILGFDGATLDDKHPAAQWLAHGLGGVLLFDRDLRHHKPLKNIVSSSQIIDLTAAIRHYAKKHPPFIAVDYEGGAVDRLKAIDIMPKSISAFDMALMSDDDYDNHLHHMAQALKQLGFNLDFAPVVDLAIEKNLGIIGHLNRAFSDSPETVIDKANRFVDVFSQYGIYCCFKHFPGHGSSKDDTHEGFVDVTSSFKPEELLPWQQAFKRQNQLMIMTAHVVNRQLDSDGIPATLSHKMLTGLLRQEYGFNGIIISDDLQMRAIANHYSLEDSLAMTFNAGADMVIFGNQLGYHDLFDLIATVEALVKSDRIPESRINEAYERVCHRNKHASP